MARAKKKKATSRKPAKKTRAKAKPKKATKARASKPKPAAKKRKGGRDSEVEKCWSAYMEQRSQLEVAVEDVQEAEEALSAARNHERQVRKDFDAAKSAFERLLEVEPAQRSSQKRRVEDIPMLAKDQSIHG